MKQIVEKGAIADYMKSQGISAKIAMRLIDMIEIHPDGQVAYLKVLSYPKKLANDPNIYFSLRDSEAMLVEHLGDQFRVRVHFLDETVEKPWSILSQQKSGHITENIRL